MVGVSMENNPRQKHIIIAPQIFVTLDPQEPQNFGEEISPRRTEIPMVWIQEGGNFRLDINLPEASVLDVYFSTTVSSLHVNGETIWENNMALAIQVPGVHIVDTPAGLRFTCNSSGQLHILTRGVTGQPTH